MSAGRLHTQVCGSLGLERHAFEHIVSGLVRAGLIDAADATFEKDGKEIAYKRLSATAAGRALAPDATLDFELTAEVSGSGPRAKKRRAKLPKRSMAPVPEEPANVDAELEQALRQWRAAEAKHAGIPAFRIFSDRTLRELAAELPADETELLLIPGLSERKVRKYGGRLLSILHPPPPGSRHRPT